MASFFFIPAWAKPHETAFFLTRRTDGQDQTRQEEASTGIRPVSRYRNNKTTCRNRAPALAPSKTRYNHQKYQTQSRQTDRCEKERKVKKAVEKGCQGTCNCRQGGNKNRKGWTKSGAAKVEKVALGLDLASSLP